ncbi:MAG TPA: hypothetical protein PKO22_08645, partial [Treponemataceae bacterium]|nr:hypothetical protein [Treponemataceae bacterium]
QDQLKVDVENFKAGRIAKDTETIKKIGGGLNDCEQRLKTAYTTLQNHIYHLRTPLVNLKQDPEAPDNFTFQITIEAFDKYTFEENYHLSVAPDKSAVEKSNKIKAFSQKSYICDIEYRIKVGESSDIYIVYLTKAQIRASDDTDYLQEYALNLRAKEFKAGQLINIGSGKNISAAAPVYVAPAPVVVQKPVAQVPAKQAKDPNRIGFRLYGGYMNSFTPGGNGFTISALLPLFDSNFILSGEYSSASSSYSFTSSQVTTTSDNHAGLGLGFAQPFGICMFSLSAQAAYLSTQSSIQDTTTTKYVSDVGYLGFTCGVDAGFDVRLGFLLLSLHVKGFLPSVTEASLLAGIRF